MKCPRCNEDMLWSNDFDYEDVGMYGEGIVSIYDCNNKDCHVNTVEIYTDSKLKDEG